MHSRRCFSEGHGAIRTLSVLHSVSSRKVPPVRLRPRLTWRAHVSPRVPPRARRRWLRFKPRCNGIRRTSVHGWRWHALRSVEKTLPRSLGHYKEWIAACKGGPKAGSDFVEKGCALTEMVLIGHLAGRLGVGKKFAWDAEAGRAKNLPEADAFIDKTYRPGWKI